MNKIVLLFCLFPTFLWAQDDLLSELESEAVQDTVYATSAFKAVKIVNFESTKLVGKEQLYFVIAHRFGSIKNGIDDLFGLDQASTRIQFVYGVNEWLNVGFSRSKFQKTYDFSAKYRLLRQREGGSPVTLVGYNLINVNTNLDKDLLPNLEFSDRLGYTTQLLVSRKFSDAFSLELIPTYFHDNYVNNDLQDNAQFALGIGGRMKLTKRLSLNIDYGLHLNRADNSSFKNPLSIGVDIETGGHVFQLHFTNAQAAFENGFLGQASGDWSEGVIFFGFNLSRTFNF
ncbi:MAG: hypothetical protein ACI828_000247 [Flavobacteriales bacterium]|jgi:hypothetical protein